jgi:hypothetical protein
LNSIFRYFVTVQTCEVYTTSVGNKQLLKPRRSPEKLYSYDLFSVKSIIVAGIFSRQI